MKIGRAMRSVPREGEPPARERKRLAFEAKRREVFEAAEKIFSRKSFHEAAMAEIAAEAGLSVGGLYKHFPSKDALYLELLEIHFRGFLDHLRREVERSPQARSAIEVVVRAHLEYFERHRDFFVIYLNDRLMLEWRIKERLGEKIHLLHVAYLDLVAGLMRRGIDEGLLRDLPPEDLAHLLISMVNSTVFQSVHRGAPDPLVDRAASIVDIFLAGARRRRYESRASRGRGSRRSS